MTKNIILYHRNCPDGSTAGAIAFKKFGEEAVYIPCSYGDGLPEEIILNTEKNETHLYILDFSFDIDTLKSLDAEFKSVTILDHHESVMTEVTSIPGGHFDNNKSGASLAWDFFFGTTVPEFVKTIETIDLFKDENNRLEDITAYINSLDYSLETYTKLLETFGDKKSQYTAEGKAINRYVRLLEDMVTSDFDVVLFEGIVMPAVNITFDVNTKSRILSKLYKILPSVAMSYRWSNGKWKISIRSDRTYDVTQIAKKYGGGGHAGASGFVIPAPNGELFFKPLGKWSEYQKNITT